MNLKEKEEEEINYWRESKFESSERFTKENFLNKMQECRHFDYKANKYAAFIRNKTRVLEVGAGQGWASCFLKKYYLPEAHFTVTDISPYAIQSIAYWEEFFRVRIDRAYAAKSYEIDAEDGQFGLVFCYAAAHHFVLLEETLTELKRVLRDDGHILFLYEPTCSALFYPLHYYYVNKMPHSTPEDVIVPSRMSAISQRAGLKYRNIYDAHQTLIRSIPLGLYFRMLGKLPFLQKALPSSSDLIFRK